MEQGSNCAILPALAGSGSICLIIISPYHSICANRITNIVGISVVLTGIAFYIWVFRHNGIGNFNGIAKVKSNGQLITSGPYRYVRHPMYSALLTTMVGCCIGYCDIHKFAALSALIIVLAMKISIEEKLLVKAFPEYSEYRLCTKYLIPLVI